MSVDLDALPIVNYRRQGTKDDGSVRVVDVTLDAVGSNQHPQQSRCKETLPNLPIQNNGHQADGIRGGNAPVLITGAAGFGGSHLVRELLNYGERVTGLDIVPPSHAGLLGQELGHPNFCYVWKSLQDIQPSDVEGHAVVAHLAAQADTPMAFGSPRYTAMQNIDGTLALLEAVRHSGGVEKLLYAGSGNEVGRPLKLPIDESHPLTPHNP